ncbi:unnamed protein product [Tetraodon nigroviridis]|uniref:(spotted green pufferfish) hypothetical protein n=1 Tax=Tetraodon nigroviridis TaxID=99883 RepID=Q4RHN5_TETNG|nr:unnamed protein product [Tetraodon nigroviridis]
MAAAASACVTFFPYQTLTQSGVKEGDSSKEINVRRWRLGSVEVAQLSSPVSVLFYARQQPLERPSRCSITSLTQFSTSLSSLD